MIEMPEHVMERFLDVADSLAFLAGEYGDDAETIDKRRTDQLTLVIESWCAEETKDPAMAALLDARAKHRAGREAPPATNRTTPREASREPRRRKVPPPGNYPCTEEGCDFVSTRLQGLSRHLNQSHGLRSNRPPVTAEQMSAPFNGTHRLTETRRDGHRFVAICACGVGSDPCDTPEAAKAELREHLAAV